MTRGEYGPVAVLACEREQAQTVPISRKPYVKFEDSPFFGREIDGTTRYVAGEGLNRFPVVGPLADAAKGLNHWTSADVVLVSRVRKNVK